MCKYIGTYVPALQYELTDTFICAMQSPGSFVIIRVENFSLHPITLMLSFTNYTSSPTINYKTIKLIHKKVLQLIPGIEYN